MAAGIAHEIRNPLASMSGSIQILRQELPLSSEQEQLMDIVLRESERLNTTIRSFLAYARPQRFAIARFDVRRALNDAALLLRNSAEVQEGHRDRAWIVPPTELWYDADEGQIKQIVWNLATNGLRAMPNGGRLQLMRRVDAVDRRRRDHGAGRRASAFRPKSSTRCSSRFTARFAKGSGLGLAIVHRIVTRLQRRDSGQLAAGRRHDGVRCACPHGPRWRHDVTDATGRRNACRPPPAAHPRRRRRAIDAGAAGDRAAGARATRCCSPRTARGAIDTLEREPVDILISDIKMPDMSGVEVLRAAKRIDQDILGIMITAFASTETAVEAMRLGACDYLSKPFDIDLLQDEGAREDREPPAAAGERAAEAHARPVAPVRRTSSAAARRCSTSSR